MSLNVQKFGGTSVADTKKLFIVTERILEEYNKNSKIVVVVSAQGKLTDTLIKEELEITKTPVSREHDVLVSTGEQITVAKLSMLLQDLGYNAISYLGWQIPIITNNCFGNADILNIQTANIEKKLAEGKIVIVAGFQGINEKGEITTLGRGGSDTTAVALAVFLHADKLYIYTDVDGVYSEDPNINKNAKKYDEISYDKMLEMANNGAKVLHNKCVQYAKENNIPIIVKSTFEPGNGTLVH